MKRFFYGLFPLLLLTSAFGQDWIRTGTGLGVEKVRIAVPDFKAASQDPKNTELLKAFNDTLWNDLDNAGIFDLVSKSFYPLGPVGAPTDVKFDTWSSPPPNAAMLAFGNLGVSGKSMSVQGWLYDVKNVTSPQVLGKQYSDAATTEAARITAHKFADEIIFRLGGGIPGIAESKIYFVSTRTGHKEIWAMDYDGANQHALTHLGSISLSPRVSPDGSRVAFSSLTKSGWEILMYSLELDRLVTFPRFGGTNLSPAWSPNGQFLVFSWIRHYGPGAPGAQDIYLMDIASKQWVQLTHDGGRNDFPYWSPDNRHIIFQSSRSGGMQIWTMLADGTNQKPLTTSGSNTQPNWSWK